MSITIGVESANGTKRVSVSTTDTTTKLYQTIQEEFKLTSQQFTLYRDRHKQQPIINSGLEVVGDSGVKHGDRIFLYPNTANLFPPEDLYYKPKSPAKTRRNDGVIHTLPPARQGG